jgi:WD40 repeat protein
VLADELSGKYVRCQECQQPFRVGAAHEGPGPEAYAPGDPASPAHPPLTGSDTPDRLGFGNFYEPPRPQRSLSKPLKTSAPWIGMGVLVLFLIRIGLVVVNSASRPAPDPPEFRMTETNWQRELNVLQQPPLNNFEDRQADSDPLEVVREFTDKPAPADLALALDGRPILRNIAFSPDGSRLMGGNGQDIIVWDVATGRELRRFSGRDRFNWAVGFLSDGNRVLFGRDDGAMQVWNIETGLQSSNFITGEKKPESAALSPDRKHVLVPSANGTISYWDVETGQFSARLVGHEQGPVAVSFTPDGQAAVSAAARTLRRWDLKSGEELGRHKIPVAASSICVSPDGRHALIGGPAGLTVLWHLDDGREEQRFQIRDPAQIVAEVCGLAFTPSGRRFLSTTSHGILRLWSINRLVPSSEIAHAGEVGEWLPSDLIAVSPDGKHVVAVDRATAKPKLLRLPAEALE